MNINKYIQKRATSVAPHRKRSIPIKKRLCLALTATLYLAGCVGSDLQEGEGAAYICSSDNQTQNQAVIDICAQTVRPVSTEEGSQLKLKLADFRTFSDSAVISVNEAQLPPWLSYDEKNQQLLGVYDESENGRVQVTVNIIEPNQSSNPLIFDISLTQKPPVLSQSVRDDNAAYVNELFAKEALFMQAGVGFDASTALTYDGHNIDRETLELEGTPKLLSAASKESLHINLLVKAINGDPLAQLLVKGESTRDARDIALEILETKITTYEAFNSEFPSYGGYLPWFVFNIEGDTTRVVPAGNWTYRMPSLDNGQLAWALYYAYHALDAIQATDLSARYKMHFDLMADNAKTLFLNDAGNAFAAEAAFGTQEQADATIPMSQQTYTKSDFVLDDPLEGELMVLFGLLFSPDLTQGEKDAIWDRKFLNSREYTTQDGEAITAVEGWVFSSHEQWKFLVLPYTDVPIARDLFINGEKIRADYANRNKLPGFFASVHDKDLNYISKVGIPGLGYDQPMMSTTLAPYATFPMILSDTLTGRDKGLQWYRNLLSADKMVGPYGVSESLDNSDLSIAPLLTWDNKATTSLAFMGGVTKDMRRFLIKDKKYAEFIELVESDYDTLPGNPMGVELSIASPQFLPGATDSSEPTDTTGAFNFTFECENLTLANTGLVLNPDITSANNSQFVGRYDDPMDEWSSVIINFADGIDLSVNNTLRIKVWAPVAGILKAKLEGGTSAPIELDSAVSVLGEWIEYSFDFSSQQGENHNSLVLFFNAGVAPAEGETTYFIDDIRFTGDEENPNIIENFECVGYPSFIGGINVVENPDVSLSNTSQTVASYVDPEGAFENIQITALEPSFDLSEDNLLKIKVWAPVAGNLVAKLEGGESAPVEVTQTISQLNEWVEYTFDFSDQAAEDHQTLVLFFNIGATTTGTDVYYFDDLRFTNAGENTKIVTDFECTTLLCAVDGLTNVANPDASAPNESLRVGAYADPAGPWDALIANFDEPLDLSANNILKFSARAPVEGLLLVKLEGGTSAPVEQSITIMQTDTWVEYTFDFSDQALENHSSLVMFFNAGVENDGTDIYHIDNIRLENAQGDANELLNFECSGVICGVNGVTNVANPDQSSDNMSERVGQIIDPVEPFAAIVFDFETSLDLATQGRLSFDLWAPVAGQLKLKLEGGTSAPMEIDMDLTTTEQWLNLVYDLSPLAGEDYTRIVLFLNAGVETTGEDVYFLDNVKFD